jgi:hypothetical protein
MNGSHADKYWALPPDRICARSGREFRALLGLVRDMAGLSYGQIAATSGISRSSVWSLGSPDRCELPRLRHQVERYLISCRLVPAQVMLIMDLWTKLHDERA